MYGDAVVCIPIETVPMLINLFVFAYIIGNIVGKNSKQ